MFVKIVRLPPFRAASFHVKESETPERDAWAQVEAWAKPRGLFDNPTVHQVYGRNNPTPPEVIPMAERRRFTAEEKLRIVEEADGCTAPGENGGQLERGLR